MSERTLDIRLSADGRKALVALCRALRLSRPGDVLRALAAMGVRVEEAPPRHALTERMRATVDARMADDLRTLAEFFDISLERQVDALLRAGLQHVRTHPCATASTTSTTTSASSRTISTTTPIASRPSLPKDPGRDGSAEPARLFPARPGPCAA